MATNARLVESHFGRSHPRPARWRTHSHWYRFGHRHRVATSGWAPMEPRGQAQRRSWCPVGYRSARRPAYHPATCVLFGRCNQQSDARPFSDFPFTTYCSPRFGSRGPVRYNSDFRSDFVDTSGGHGDRQQGCRPGSDYWHGSRATHFRPYAVRLAHHGDRHSDAFDSYGISDHSRPLVLVFGNSHCRHTRRARTNGL